MSTTRRLLGVHYTHYFLNNIFTAAVTIRKLTICDCIILRETLTYFTSTFLNYILDLCIIALYILFADLPFVLVCLHNVEFSF